MIEHPPQQPQQSKRDFLKYVLGGSLFVWIGTVLYPVLSYLKPPSQAEAEVSSVKVGKLSDIEKDSGTIVKFGSKPVILLRTANGDLRAFSATCTAPRLYRSIPERFRAYLVCVPQREV